jgi:Flp pilus assembly protein TadD
MNVAPGGDRMERPMRLALFTVLCALALAGCQTTGATSKTTAADTETSQADRLVRLAGDIESRGEHDTAMALYARAAALPEASAAANVKAGDAYLRAGYLDEAMTQYRVALVKSPDNSQAMFGLGSALTDSGDPNAGLRALGEAAPIINTGRAYNRLGVAQTMAGQTQEAQSTFATALKLQPDDLDLQINMALAAALEGNASVALPIAQRVAASGKAQLRHKNNIVIVYGLLGQDEQVKAAPPTGLSSKEITTLLARCKEIRAKGSVKAKAAALGSMTA